MSFFTEHFGWFREKKVYPRLSIKDASAILLATRITDKIDNSAKILIDKLSLGAEMAMPTDRIEAFKKYVDDVTLSARDAILAQTMIEIDRFIQTSLNDATTEVHLDEESTEDSVLSQ